MHVIFLSFFLFSSFFACRYTHTEELQNFWQQSTHTKSVRGCEGWGFFAEFLWALNHLHDSKMHGKTPVIYWGEKFAYFCPEGYNGSFNGWEYYFEPVSDLAYTNNDSLIIKPYYNDSFSTLWFYDQYIENFHLCTDQEKANFINITKEKTAPWGKYPVGEKHLYNEEFRAFVKNELIDPYVKIKPSIAKKIDLFYATNMAGKKNIAIHLRGGFIIEKVPLVPIEIILAEANKYAGPHVQFFIATDQAPLLEKAKELLSGPVIYYESERFATTTSPKPGQKLHPVLGEVILIETILLSRCDHFVHTLSNVPTAALYFNPTLKHTVLY